MALPKIAMVVKFLRSSILTEMNREYVRTAYSRGNTETAVLYGHVLKNAMIPVVTFFAMVIAEILAGSIVAEQVFSVPGIGRLLISSISNRDYPVVQAIVLYITSLFIGAGVEVYEGMIVGQSPKDEDIVVNVCKKKHMTNTRASGSDDALRLIPPKVMSLEQAIEFITDDELIEVTPKRIRMRKRILDKSERMKAWSKNRG